MSVQWDRYKSVDLRTENFRGTVVVNVRSPKLTVDITGGLGVVFFDQGRILLHHELLPTIPQQSLCQTHSGPRKHRSRAAGGSLMRRGIIQLVDSEALFHEHKYAKPGLPRPLEIRGNCEEWGYRPDIDGNSVIIARWDETGRPTLPKLEPTWLITGPYVRPCSAQGMVRSSTCSCLSRCVSQCNVTPFNLSARSNAKQYGKRGCLRKERTCCMIELQRSQNLAGDSKSWNSGRASPGARSEEDPKGMKGRVWDKKLMESEMFVDPPRSNHSRFRNGLKLRGPPVLIGSLLRYSHSSLSISPRM